MLRFLVIRLFQGTIVIVAVIFFLSLMGKLVPGDIVDIIAANTIGFTDEDAARLRHSLGLDLPFHIQFLNYLQNLLHGDLGDSLRHHKPNLDLLIERVPPTIELTLIAFVMGVVVAIPFGVVMALRQGKVFDYVGTVVSVLGVATPGFLIGILLILFFSVQFNLLPPSGRRDSLFIAGFQAIAQLDAGIFWGSFRYYIMPATSLALLVLAINARLLRSTMLEVVRQDFIQFARAKGVPEHAVMIRHALRNALIPTITIMGLQLGFLVSGAFIIENVFAWPGIGRLVVEAVASRDFQLVQASVLVSAVLFVVLNILVDIIYHLVDPRIQYARER